MVQVMVSTALAAFFVSLGFHLWAKEEYWAGLDLTDLQPNPPPPWFVEQPALLVGGSVVGAVVVAAILFIAWRLDQ